MEKKPNEVTSSYQPLFDHMLQEHNLTLLESEMADIVHLVKDIEPTPQAAVWVKATDRLPGWDKLAEWRFVGKEPTAKETVRFLFNAANLDRWEWLDEQPEQGEADAVEFAEWAAEGFFFDDEYRLWECLEEGKMIDGQFRFTTKELYELFKKK